MTLFKGIQELMDVTKKILNDGLTLAPLSRFLSYEGFFSCSDVELISLPLEPGIQSGSVSLYVSQLLCFPRGDGNQACGLRKPLPLNWLGIPSSTQVIIVCSLGWEAARYHVDLHPLFSCAVFCPECRFTLPEGCASGELWKVSHHLKN